MKSSIPTNLLSQRDSQQTLNYNIHKWEADNNTCVHVGDRCATSYKGHLSTILPDLLRVLVGVLSAELFGEPFFANTAAGFSGLGGLA